MRKFCDFVLEDGKSIAILFQGSETVVLNEGSGVSVTGKSAYVDIDIRRPNCQEMDLIRVRGTIREIEEKIYASVPPKKKKLKEEKK